MSDNQALDQKIDIPADTFSAIFKHSQKVRRNPLQDHFYLKINAAFLITQYGGSDACGGNGGEFSATSAIPNTKRDCHWAIPFNIANINYLNRYLLPF